MAPKTSRAGRDELLDVGRRVEVCAMTGPVGQLRRAWRRAAPVSFLGTLSWTNWSPRMVVRLMAALTSAGMRTPLSKASVTLALSPSSAMELHRADGHVGQLHLGPVGQIADVGEDGRRRALAPAAGHGAAGERRRPARPGRAPRPGDGAAAVRSAGAHQNHPSTSCTQPDRRPRGARCRGGAVRLVLGQRGQQRGGGGGQGRSALRRGRRRRGRRPASPWSWLRPPG